MQKKFKKEEKVNPHKVNSALSKFIFHLSTRLHYINHLFIVKDLIGWKSHDQLAALAPIYI